MTLNVTEVTSWYEKINIVTDIFDNKYLCIKFIVAKFCKNEEILNL